MNYYKTGTVIIFAIASVVFPSGSLSAKKHPAQREQKSAANAPSNNDAAGHSARGVEAEKNRQYDKAVAEFAKAVEAQPTEAKHYYNRATAYRLWGKFSEAITDFSKSIELAPKDAAAYIGRGEVQLIQHQLEPAITDFNKALELAPDNLSVLRFRAFTYRTLKRYPESVADYSKVVEMTKGKDAESYRQRGLTYALAGDKQKATEDFQALLKLAPDDADAQARLKLLNSSAAPNAPATSPAKAPAMAPPAASPH